MNKAILFSLLAAMATGATANEHIKNGMPCLEKLCIGDEISTLGKIKWVPSTTLMFSKPISTFKVTPVMLEAWKSKVPPEFHGALPAAIPYLSQWAFDNAGIPKLMKIKGYCERFEVGVIGRYLFKNGTETQVTVNVEPGADSSTQTLRVTGIVRTYPERATAAQMEKLREQYRQRFASLPNPSSVKPDQASWKFENSELRLTAPAMTKES